MNLEMPVYVIAFTHFKFAGNCCFYKEPGNGNDLNLTTQINDAARFYDLGSAKAAAKGFIPATKIWKGMCKKHVKEVSWVVFKQPEMENKFYWTGNTWTCFISKAKKYSSYLPALFVVGALDFSNENASGIQKISEFEESVTWCDKPGE